MPLLWPWDALGCYLIRSVRDVNRLVNAAACESGKPVLSGAKVISQELLGSIERKLVDARIQQMEDSILSRSMHALFFRGDSPLRGAIDGGGFLLHQCHFRGVATCCERRRPFPCPCGVLLP